MKNSYNTNENHPKFLAPAIVTLVLFLLTYFFWKKTVHYEEEQYKLKIRIEANSIQNTIHDTLNSHEKSLLRMARRWEIQGGTPEKLWRADALIYSQHLAGSVGIGYADSESIVQWFEPKKQNLSIIGFQLNTDENIGKTLDLVTYSGSPALTQSIKLKQGGEGFLLIVPIHKTFGHAGYIYMAINYEKLFKTLITNDDYLVVIHEKNNLIYSSTNDLEERAAIKRLNNPINISGTNWDLIVRPSANSLSFMKQNNIFSLIVLSVGALLSVLGGILVYLYLVASYMSRRSGALLQWNNAIVNGSELAIVSSNIDGIIQSFNPAAEKLLEHSAKDVIGFKNLIIWLLPEELTARSQELSQQLGHFIPPGFAIFTAKAKMGDVYQDTWTLYTKNRHLKTATIALHALRRRDGVINGYVAIIDDITDKIKKELALKEALDKAESATMAKSQFLANMSHEIRTPMNSILGMSELLSETELTSEQKSYITVFQRAGNSLLDIINDILDISKIESGLIVLEKTPFCIRDLLDDVIAIFIQKTNLKNLDLFENISSDVPAIVIGDALRLRQIITNLLGNAVKFTSKGKIEIEIKPNTDNLIPGNLLFIISDTGIGISEDKIKNLFKIFTQGDSSITKNFGGTGLGLSISKQFIEMMGGRIWITSIEGVGSQFYFTVNLLESKQEILIKKDNYINKNKNIESDRPLKILLVDDSEDNRILIISYLKHTSHIIVEARNGIEAFEKYKSEIFDLVLMDMQMPIRNGYEATQDIRKWEQDSQRARTPIFALTAYAISGEQEKSIASGCDHHITKPVQKQTLLKILGHL